MLALIEIYHLTLPGLPYHRSRFRPTKLLVSASVVAKNADMHGYFCGRRACRGPDSWFNPSRISGLKRRIY
jgi:hypothetical protein